MVRRSRSSCDSSRFAFLVVAHFISSRRAVFFANDQYYLWTSATDGWSPCTMHLYTADSPLGAFNQSGLKNTQGWLIGWQPTPIPAPNTPGNMKSQGEPGIWYVRGHALIVLAWRGFRTSRYAARSAPSSLGCTALLSTTIFSVLTCSIPMTSSIEGRSDRSQPTFLQTQHTRQGLN